jgi:alcohol dehydrogenase
LKAAFIARYGATLALGERPDPRPGPYDLLVRVCAASVNPIDVKTRQGKAKLLLRYDFPLTLGSDLSGVVVQAGPAVTRFRTGDLVFARVDKERIGAFAELALVREADAALKPASLTHEQAASLPLVGLTSWQALVEIGRLGPGQSVLIHAGAGGVGSFAIQLARHLGARVITTASERNSALCQRLGADQVIDYRRHRFDDLLRQSPVDLVLDTIGGDTLLRSLAVTRRGGTVVSIASLPDAPFARRWGLPRPWVWLLALLTSRVTLRARRRGVRFEFLFMHPSGEQLARIAALADSRVIVPVLDRTFPFEQTGEALAYLATGRATGKVIIQVAPDAAPAAARAPNGSR